MLIRKKYHYFYCNFYVFQNMYLQIFSHRITLRLLQCPQKQCCLKSASADFMWSLLPFLPLFYLLPFLPPCFFLAPLFVFPPVSLVSALSASFSIQHSAFTLHFHRKSNFSTVQNNFGLIILSFCCSFSHVLCFPPDSTCPSSGPSSL